MWKSRDLTGVAVFLAGLGAVKASWDWVESRIVDLFEFGFDKVTHPVELETAVVGAAFMGLTAIITLSVPALLACAAAGGLLDFLIVGPLIAKEAVLPKLEKLNPIQGFKNLFSKKQLVEAVKSTLKIGIAGYVAYGAVRASLPEVVLSIRGDATTTLAILGDLVFTVTVRIGILFIVFAIFDVWFQHRSYMKDLMMTKEEVKREYKENEGDPHHKAKRREMHQEILESAQMEAVKGADVIVTNPDHVAVALVYDRERDNAPRVVCKGVDHRAQAIKALARENDVPVLRNVPLAHALLRVEVNGEIPEALYDAVAEVLNFVYGLKDPRAAA